MSTTGTKIPSIYKVPSTADPELRQFAESVKEALEVRLGRRGDPKDRAVTLRELIDSGLAKELLDNPFDPNTGTGVTDFAPPTFTSSTIPPTPTGFSASAAYSSFILSWDNPQYNGFAYTEVWRHTIDEVGTATRVDTTRAFVWSEEVGYNRTYFYWVRHVSTSDVLGAFSTSGTGTTSVDIGAVMISLSETLANLPGYTTLTTLISTSSAVAARVIRSSGAPSTREDSSALTVNDIWYDTDDGQVYTRNAANNAWVAARDATLVSLYGSTSYTGSTITGAIATAQGDIVTVTNAHSSTATSLTNLTATVDTKARTFIQTSAPTATAVGDIWIDSDDSNKMYRAASATADQITSGEWVLVRDTLNDSYPRVFTQNDSPTAINTGDIWFDTNDSNKQYRWDGSSWTLIRDVTTSAAVTTEATARASGDSANATSINNLTATVNTKNQTFVQDAVPTSIQVGDLWIDSNDSNKLYRANAAGISAIVTSGNGWYLVRDTVNDGYPRVFSQDAVPTSINEGDLWFDTNDSNKQYRADAAGSDQITSGEWELVRDVTSEAAITTEASTRASGDTANATSITNLTSTVSGNTTNITTVQNAVANGTSAEAGYGVAVNANGAIAGMYLMANSSGTLQNNTSTSNIIFEAAQVTIRNPHGSNIVPFTVLTSTDGNSNPAGVYIDAAYIKNAAITNAKIGLLAVDTAQIADAAITTLKVDTLSGSVITTESLNIGSRAISSTIGLVAGADAASTTVTASAFDPNTFLSATPNWIVSSDVMTAVINQAFTTPTHSGGGTKKYVVRGSWTITGAQGIYVMQSASGMTVSTDSSASATTTPVTSVFLGASGAPVLQPSVYADIIDLASATTYYMRIYVALRSIWNGANYNSTTVVQASITVEGLSA